MGHTRCLITASLPCLCAGITIAVNFCFESPLAAVMKLQPHGAFYVLRLAAGEALGRMQDQLVSAVPALDLSVTLPLVDADQETFSAFNLWIKDYNEYVVKAYKEAQESSEDDSLKEIVDEFVEVQEAA